MLSTCVSGDDLRARIVAVGRLAEIEELYQPEAEPVQTNDAVQQKVKQNMQIRKAVVYNALCYKRQPFYCEY